MAKLSLILRLISLSFLFGGSATTVFVAIILVKAAEANGMPNAEAAAINAPAFIQFAKVVAVAAIGLLVSEFIDLYIMHREKKKVPMLTRLKVLSSAFCFVATFAFSFVIVPPMDELRTQIKTDVAKKEEFDKLHKMSRMVFGGTILFALLGLILQGVEPRTLGKD